MGKRFKNKPKPEGDMLINATKKMFPFDVELDVGFIIMCTESNIPKSGKGVTSLCWKVKEAWVGKDGNIVVYADPEAKIDNILFDKYGNVVTDKEIEANRPTGKSMFRMPYGHSQKPTNVPLKMDKSDKKVGHQKGSTKEKA